jgi:anti-sigma regulatory factor (Ser/Thr protein kinase)
MSSFAASVDLLPVPRSVRLARHLVGDLLAAWGSPHAVDDAALLVTELVANVVDHVGGDATFRLELTLDGEWLRIAVVDGSAVRPVVRELSTERLRGRGMQLVVALAERWGVEDHDGGKRVWFELPPS